MFQGCFWCHNGVRIQKGLGTFIIGASLLVNYVKETGLNYINQITSSACFLQCPNITDFCGLM